MYVLGMFILISLAVVVQVVICQDCFFKSSLYIGRVNKTVDNVTCDRWDAHLSHIDPLTLNLSDVSTSEAANYCRDPDEKGHPWCYVSNDPHHKTWEFCDVLFCRECYFANRSNEYNGYVTTSMNGNCLAWTGTSFPDSSFPDGSVARARNYCRDPDNRGYPHCLTNHGFLPCLIPKCNHSVCADDPNTLCEILKSVICGVKDMAQKLCPKTCSMCGFSLMSPVHIKPPVHNAIHPACEDNPMARCDTLKQFICGTAQATQLCPKTCNLCSAPTTATLTKPPRDSGLLCYSCTNVPHPRNCNRIVRCRSSEACSVESFVTPSGTTVYDMGCSSQLNCQNSNSPPVGRRESMLPALKKRENILVCKECCHNNSFCNRELCDTKVNLTGKLCMQCADVVSPQDCATVALCQAGEICYTESITIHGENRYRLGCVKETSCRPLAASETITTLSPLLTTCGVCCKRDIENCNLELCDQRGGIPPKDAVQMYLVDPPIDTNGAYCHDQSEVACIYIGAAKHNFCDSPSIKNQLCPKFCGTCIPSPTLAPVKFTTDGRDTTHSRVVNSTIDTTHQSHTSNARSTTTSPIRSTSECFFRSVVYLGGVSKTIDNIICDRWDTHLLPNDPLVSMFPDESLELAANYCRDPDNKGHPWCYITGHPSKSWEFCDVPYCNECYYKNQSHVYNGYVSVTNNGECLNWAGSFPESSFIDGNITKTKNYCRDPDNTGYPYCRTTRGLFPCIISQCQGTCENDPASRCELLKTVICQREHLARLLCPRTCNMCGFGLLEPVHRPPPVHQANNTYNVTSTMSTTRSISTLPPATTISSPPPTIIQDICVDKFNMSCNNPEIKSLICIERLVALNYCRKTCDLCGQEVLPLRVDSCGDPIKEPMCKLLHNEVCLCNDKIISSVLCPHYCAKKCGPVNETLNCPDPSVMTLVGRRLILN